MTFYGEGECFSAMFRAQNLLIEQRPASTVDQIRTKGDRLVPKLSAACYCQTIIFIIVMNRARLEWFT